MNLVVGKRPCDADEQRGRNSCSLGKGRNGTFLVYERSAVAHLVGALCHKTGGFGFDYR